MNSPYKTPMANMNNSDQEVSVNTAWWKIVLFILVPLDVWGRYDTYTVNEFNQSLEWQVLSILIYCVLYISLFGLAFGKRIFGYRFWTLFLPVLIVDDISTMFLIFGGVESDIVMNVITLAIILPILFVPWYAVYKYSRVMKFNKEKD